MWLSNANWKAIVMADLEVLLVTARSFDGLLPPFPVSRADARSTVRFGLDATCEILQP